MKSRKRPSSGLNTDGTRPARGSTRPPNADHHAEAEHVHHPGEAAVFRAHLRIDAPRGLDAPDQPVLDALHGQAAAPASPRSAPSPRAHQRLAADALRRSPRDATDATRGSRDPAAPALIRFMPRPLGDRRVDVQRLHGRSGSRASADCAPRVRMLCRRSASLIRMTRRSRDIASSILRKLSAASRRSRNSLSSLVTPSTRSGDGLAELRCHVAASQQGVLDGVVQDRRHQRLHVQPPATPAPGDRHRMGDVGLADLRVCPACAAAPTARHGAAGALRGQVKRRPFQRLHIVRHLRLAGRGMDGIAGRIAGTHARAQTRGAMPANRARQRKTAPEGAVREHARQGISRRPSCRRRRRPLRRPPTPAPRAPCARAGLLDGIDVVGVDLAGGDLAQGQHGRLVVGFAVVQLRLHAASQLARAWQPSSRARSGCRPPAGNLRR